MAEQHVVWFANSVTGRPERRTCEKPGYPNSDDQGETMYENTHYSTERAAWLQVIRETKAGAKLGASAVMQARAELLRVEKRALDDLLLAIRAESAFEEFKELQKND